MRKPLETIEKTYETSATCGKSTKKTKEIVGKTYDNHKKTQEYHKKFIGKNK